MHATLIPDYLEKPCFNQLVATWQSEFRRNTYARIGSPELGLWFPAFFRPCAQMWCSFGFFYFLFRVLGLCRGPRQSTMGKWVFAIFSFARFASPSFFLPVRFLLEPIVHGCLSWSTSSVTPDFLEMSFLWNSSEVRSISQSNKQKGYRPFLIHS